MVAPAQHVRAISRELAAHVRDGQPLVLCAKGIEQSSGKMMGEVIAEALAGRDACRACRARASPPTWRAGLPAALTVACRNERPGALLAERFGYHQFLVVLVVGRDRRRAWRRLEERARHRRRHRRRQGPRRQRARGPRDARICRDAPLGRSSRRAHRNADGSFGPRRPHSHLRQPAITQHEPRPGTGPGREARGRARHARFRHRGHLHRGGGRAARAWTFA